MVFLQKSLSVSKYHHTWRSNWLMTLNLSTTWARYRHWKCSNFLIVSLKHWYNIYYAMLLNYFSWKISRFSNLLSFVILFVLVVVWRRLGVHFFLLYFKLEHCAFAVTLWFAVYYTDLFFSFLLWVNSLCRLSCTLLS